MKIEIKWGKNTEKVDVIFDDFNIVIVTESLNCIIENVARMKNWDEKALKLAFITRLEKALFREDETNDRK